MIREGSIRRDLEQIAAIKAHGIDTRRLILTTDGIAPRDLLEKGYLECVVQKAIDCGFAPIEAVQMASLNVAEHFGLDGLIGGIAPGRYADLVIIPDSRTITPQLVVSNGQIIARNGELLVSPRKHSFRRKSFNSIKLPRKLNSSDFFIPADPKAAMVTVRMIQMVTDLVTAEARLEWPVINGQIQPDPEHDVIKVAAVDRTHCPGKIFVGLIKGFGLKTGAIACSAAWDTSDIVVVGTDDTDMATAVNRIFALQGGAVVCKDSAILVELPLSIYGLISDWPLETIAQRLQQMNATVSALGVAFPDPLLTLSTLTGAAIPYFRICEEGLVNLKDGRTLRLLVD
jgi:adenine deaminase